MLYLTVPDKRFTFDHKREITDFEHLVRDYEEGPEWSYHGHYEDYAWATHHINQISKEEHLANLLDTRHSIHFHVWDHDAFHDFLLACKKRFDLPIEVVFSARNSFENLYILQK